MSETALVTEDSIHRFVARCEDCGISKGYHTDLGLRYFEDLHNGHYVKVKDRMLEEEDGPEFVEPQFRSARENDVLDTLSNVKVILEESQGQEVQTHEIEPEQTVELLSPESTASSNPILPLVSPSDETISPAEVSVVHIKTSLEEPLLDEEPCLLLSKFSFVKEGERYRQESVRISQALRDLRWKIEPPYVICALFDDTLGIESNTGSIGRDLISKIEEIGYSFVAMEAPKGVPTAWFKRED